MATATARSSNYNTPAQVAAFNANVVKAGGQPIPRRLREDRGGRHLPAAKAGRQVQERGPQDLDCNRGRRDPPDHLVIHRGGPGADFVSVLTPSRSAYAGSREHGPA